MSKKQKWFEAQCLKQGICAEDILVVGDYATNKEGDFLYSVTHEVGEDTMNCVAACDLADLESNYAEWLLNLMQNLEDNFYEGDMRFQHRSWWDKEDIPVVFKECICRNRGFSERYRNELRQKPAMGVHFPVMDIDSSKNEFLGLIAPEDEFEQEVIAPKEVMDAGGYKFALKLIDSDKFFSTYSFRNDDHRFGPYEILAKLEKSIATTWTERGRLDARVTLPLYDDCEIFDVCFCFSHFEVEDELDEDCRTCFACYAEMEDI